MSPTFLTGPRVAPYVDVVLPGPSLAEISKKVGLKYFTVAFALGGSGGCEPSWGGREPITDKGIIENIRGLQELGGQVIVATGGALGPYLETACASVVDLVEAYIKILDTVKTDHLDIDIEASVPADTVTRALAEVQEKRPNTTVRLTLMVQGDDYGLTPELGVNFLKKAKANNLRVDIVNPMTMEFGTSKSDWGEAVILALESTKKQMSDIWPELTDQALYAMLGATPMIGRNFNGKIFTQDHAKSLIKYAKEKNLGYLGFWSVSRDNGKCPNGGISPSCSSIKQEEYEFCKIFGEYDGPPVVVENGTRFHKEDGNSKGSGGLTGSKDKKGGKVCVGKEARFNEWCVANCAVGHCPKDICTCGVGLKAPTAKPTVRPDTPSRSKTTSKPSSQSNETLVSNDTISSTSPSTTVPVSSSSTTTSTTTTSSSTTTTTTTQSPSTTSSEKSVSTSSSSPSSITTENSPSSTQASLNSTLKYEVTKSKPLKKSVSELWNFNYTSPKGNRTVSEKENDILGH